MKTKKLLFQFMLIVYSISVYAQVPAPAAAVGFNLLTWNSTTITAPGGGGWISDMASTNVQNTDGSLTTSMSASGYMNSLSTVQMLGGYMNFKGKAFGGGGYFEAEISIAGSISQNHGWPGWWSNDVEMQTDQWGPGVHWQGQAAGYGNWIEPDFMEWFDNSGYGGSLHCWYGPQSNIGNLQAESAHFVKPSGFDPAAFHTYGFLWVTATPTTQGYCEFYCDRVRWGNRVSWNQYNPSDPPPPTVGTTAGAVLDSRHLYLMLGSGVNAMTVRKAQVWQKSNANNIPNTVTTNVNGLDVPTIVASVYPNPFNTNFTLKISDETILKNAIIKMYDVCGREVKTVLINSNETTIDRDELQSGIYFYSIINNNEKIANGKLIVSQ